MRVLFLMMMLCVMSACSSYNEADLYGTWRGDEMEFTFNADKTMHMKQGLNLDVSGKYNPFGNTIELINESNKVIFTIHVKELKGTDLTIDIPSLGTSRIYNLKKVV